MININTLKFTIKAQVNVLHGLAKANDLLPAATAENQ